ncbi:2-hydroxyacid dehydrogenase [Arthrobacter tumbae]|uniref:2-hydroxyacid dehydrogenase n=1 Tax=Arthrobacter tumbae TaxID=163874 RepID=UPI00195E59A4|nr:2-hydroxyacid dehydrogenase [Arthrobacter tumbae]MBM7780890.1 D-3-phosphoglycerate dehydrogenase [Arthrobacter tumbae]
MTTRILAAGDHFVTSELLINAIEREIPGGASCSRLTLPWPTVPFGRVAEVDEASGSEDELVAALQGVEICVTQMAPLTEAVLAQCPDLRLFCIGRGGPVNANLDAATRHGVAVTYAPGRNSTATAEHTIAMMLAAARRIPATHGDLLAGQWRGDYYMYDQVGPELEGSTVGLVGYGAIGRKVARILGGFGARVLVSDPYITQDELGDSVELVQLEELLHRSRIVSLHARVTDETVGMIGAPEIAAMPQGSVLVNCARGALLNYDAALDALETGHLFGAAFDVFAEEPIPARSRLLSTPGVVMTPHLAGSSKETAHNAAAIIAGEVGRYLRGDDLQYRANSVGEPAGQARR